MAGRREVTGAGAAKPVGMVPALCGCPRRIRVSPSVLELGPVAGGNCDTEFAVETE